MRRFAPLLALPLAFAATACQPDIAITGFDIGRMFPTTTQHFWKYNHDDDADVGYIVTEGTVSPEGEDWMAYRFYFGDEQEMVDAFAEDPSTWDHWSAVLYFIDRSSGWHFMGWAGNPEVMDIGSVTMDDDGIPFAVSGAFSDSTWTGSGGGMTWTMSTNGVIVDPLVFNGQEIESAWHMILSSDSGDTQMEGEWWLVQGIGIVQFDVAGLAQGELTPWQHQHNDVLANITGVPNR
jgi:hypothetical protein